MSQKRQRLLDTALTLFYQNGINSVGINEILAVSGIAKRTLYIHFPSKDALVFAALQQRHDIFIAWLKQKLANTKSTNEVIHSLFSALESWFSNQEAELGPFRGCFFINTSAEFSDINSDIFNFCHHHKQQVRQVIADHLISNNSELLEAMCIMKEGAIVTAHLCGSGKEVTANCIKILEKLETS
ncbi:TetR/AcrR family transcriptional regulator [Shewanella algidipiscicola]|uniref:TetR family transcriptional regulator n=1 Tax=Shewanella algidipiscicola TaxID=614070 RepID=A0ABQ4PHB5_9GAMM|nr:TetR/AcrR family transcriptional regulator [Shewanella algidipiscicola]GIU46928.1 TetR family transcriptional regulator [Shewanella algidipiscicola]